MLPSDDRADRATARCPECGAWQVASASHCTSCGAALAPAGAQAQSAGLYDKSTVLMPGYDVEAPPPLSAETADQEPAVAQSSADAGPAEPPAHVLGADDADAEKDDNGAGPVASSESRRCEWCGTPNPDGAEWCTKCGAAFPKPEQDEALLRASQERIRAATESIELMRRQRGKRGLGRWWDR